MKEHDYSNREIDRMFKEIIDILNEIKVQTTKTNGRVSALEMWREGMMAKIGGILVTVGVVWVFIKELIKK